MTDEDERASRRREVSTRPATQPAEKHARLEAGTYLVRAARYVVRLGEAGLADEPWVTEVRAHIAAADTARDDIDTLRGHVEAIRAILTVHRILEPPESPRQN